MGTFIMRNILEVRVEKKIRGLIDGISIDIMWNYLERRG